MGKRILVVCIMFIIYFTCFSYMYASTYEWDIGGLKQMDYDSIDSEEVEIELSFYCGVNNKMEGGPMSAASKLLVYGNLANNYYTGKKSINGGKSWEDLNNGYSLGTNVYIKDVGLFTIEDRGGSSDFNKTNRMDLFVARKEGESDSEWEKRTNSYGHQKVKAKIIKSGTERNWVWPSGNSTPTTSTSSETTSTSSNKINFKIEYNETKKITTMGEKPIDYTTNCKDAVDQYWNKTTTVSSDGSTDTGIGNSNVPGVGGGTKVFISASNQLDNTYTGVNITEHGAMYKLGEELEKILKGKGYTTYLYSNPNHNGSISSNISTGLSWLNNKESGLYIALHSNAGGGTAPETFYYESDQKSKKAAQAVNDSLYELYKSKGFTGKNRGIKSAQSHGINEVKNTGKSVVSILTEVAFHDNKKEAEYIANSSTDIAQAIADAIAEVFPITASGKYTGMEYSSFTAIPNMKNQSYETKKAKITSMTDLEALARVIHGEQGGNSFESQVFVGMSVINRTRTSGWAGENTIQGKISASGQYDAINGNAFWGDIPQEAVNAAKVAIEAVNKGEYYLEAYQNSSSTAKIKMNVVSVEAFQANNDKSFFTSRWSGWNNMILRGIIENTAGYKYTGFYWR